MIAFKGGLLPLIKVPSISRYWSVFEVTFTHFMIVLHTVHVTICQALWFSKPFCGATTSTDGLEIEKSLVTNA